jgi:hypothetical protein
MDRGTSNIFTLQGAERQEPVRREMSGPLAAVRTRREVEVENGNDTGG